MQIAIDGPAGSGKSTIAKIIAEKFDLIYLDTGAMYRAAAWLMLKYKLTLAEIGKLLEEVDFIFSDNGKILTLCYTCNKVEYITNVTEIIRTPEVTNTVSAVAAEPVVRRILTEKQQEIAGCKDVIMDGRDIGTTVLPKADFKFFLTASPEERAKRRALEWEKTGKTVDYTSVLKSIIERDKLDSTREVSPLKKAEDALEIDTTSLTIDEVTEIIYAVVVKFHNMPR